MVADFPPEALGYNGVNIPQTANDLDTDSIAFECEQIAEQADAIANDGKSPGIAADLARLIASTNRNMARMMNRG